MASIFTCVGSHGRLRFFTFFLIVLTFHDKKCLLYKLFLLNCVFSLGTPLFAQKFHFVVGAEKKLIRAPNPHGLASRDPKTQRGPIDSSQLSHRTPQVLRHRPAVAFSRPGKPKPSCTAIQCHHPPMQLRENMCARPHAVFQPNITEIFARLWVLNQDLDSRFDILRQLRPGRNNLLQFGVFLQ